MLHEMPDTPVARGYRIISVRSINKDRATGTPPEIAFDSLSVRDNSVRFALSGVSAARHFRALEERSLVERRQI
jgi:hypothetical protein